MAVAVPMPQAAASRDAFGFSALFEPFARRLALFVVAASLVYPFSGFGLDLCALHALTGLPCPGCGLTRSFVALAAFDLEVAVGAHPFVVVAFPLFVVLAALELLPRRLAWPIMQKVTRHAPTLSLGYRAVVLAFAGFGLLRLFYFAVSGDWFP